METKAHLIAARDLILDPAHWTSLHMARDAAGAVVLPAEPSACQWCALGALYKVDGRVPSHYDKEPAYLALFAANNEKPVTSTNDFDGHAAIMALYDRAIE